MAEKMTDLELLMIFGVPGMFLAAGLFMYGVVVFETRRFDRRRNARRF